MEADLLRPDMQTKSLQSLSLYFSNVHKKALLHQPLTLPDTNTRGSFKA